MKFSKILTEYDKTVKEYDKLFDETLPEIELKGKVIEQLTHQVTLMIQWEVMTKRLNKLHDDCIILAEDEYGRALQTAMRDKYREVSISEAKEYAKMDDGYKNSRKLLNKIRHVRDEARGILEVIHSRKYILNNVVQSITADAENYIL